MNAMKIECPKCKSPNAGYRKTETDLLLVCICGYQKVLFTTLLDTLEGGLEDEIGDKKSKLPKMGTHLYKTLVIVSILTSGSSKDITDRMNELNGIMRVPGLVTRSDLSLTVSDVSSYLTILRCKGLVDRGIVRRGVKGGSTWDLTSEAVTLLDLED